MQLYNLPHSVFRPVPPPLWYVTNGELTVGPVVTGLLLRGVEHGRVPDYCHVRTMRGGWRALDAVREIAVLNGSSSPSPQSKAYALFSERSRPLASINDEDELCELITRLSLIVTGAESAMLHFLGRSQRSLTTRSVVGPVSRDRLGYAMPEDDLVLKSARNGRPILGPPFGPAENALTLRFASSAGGVGAVAMVPIFAGSTLKAMLEVSRPGHAFRRTDLQRAERVAQSALRMRSN
jgi:hypothetical protein